MKFGEKVRWLRKERNLSQTELGKLCGLSMRTIRNYEADGRYPKQRAVYAKLADALGCEVNFLLSEAEPTVPQAARSEGRNIADAKALVAEISALFAGDELSDRDKDAVMRALQEAYWHAKDGRSTLLRPTGGLK